ncbi:MAG: ATP-binding protein, partial [Actinomycetota bacterium]|nr:ATP-binding protein [Actinomycetota bacterium]
VLPFPEFEEVSVNVEPDTTVVLYTDGLVERPGENIDLGLRRLAESVHAAPNDPQMLCDELLDSLIPDGAPSDDVAVLALRMIPMSDRFDVELFPEPEALVAMRALLRRWLRYAKAGEDELAEIITACGEAATNAIQHSGASGGTTLELSGRLEGRTVELTLSDHGAWRTPRKGERGRGIALMRGLMDEVEVTATSQGTTVRMSRTLH